MDAKNYLQQAYTIDKKIKLDLQKLEAAKASLQGRAVNYERIGAAPSVRRNSTEDSLVRVMDYESRINSEIETLTLLRSEIEKEIYEIPDEKLRELLTRRYLMYQKWELIAEEMNYGLRHIYKLHSKALNAFDSIAS